MRRVALACGVLMLAGCASEPKADVNGRGPTQQYVGQSDTVEISVTNEDTRAFPGVAVQFEQQAWTILSVEPEGVSYGDGTYGVGSLDPGETLEIVARMTAHTPGNHLLTMNVYADARPDGIRSDYLTTLELDVAVLP